MREMKRESNKKTSEGNYNKKVQRVSGEGKQWKKT